MKTIYITIICIITSLFITSCHDSEPHDTSSLNGSLWINRSTAGNPNHPFVNEITREPEVYAGTLIEFKNDGSVDVYALDDNNMIDSKILSTDSYYITGEGRQLVFYGKDMDWGFEIESKDKMVRAPWTVRPAYYILPGTDELMTTTEPGENYERIYSSLSSFIRPGN